MKQMTKEELIEYFIEQLGDNEVLGQVMTIEQIREKLQTIIKDVTYNSEPGNFFASWDVTKQTLNFDFKKNPFDQKDVTIVHELIHVLSSSELMNNDSKYKSFIYSKVGIAYMYSMKEGNERVFISKYNSAVNEGITDYLAEKIIGQRNNGYYEEKNIYRLLSLVIGEDVIMQKYFANIKESFSIKELDNVGDIFKEELVQKYGLQLGIELNEGVKKVLSLADQLYYFYSKDSIYGLNENGSSIRNKIRDEISNTLVNMLERVIDNETDFTKKFDLINTLKNNFSTTYYDQFKAYRKVQNELINSTEFSYIQKVEMIQKLKSQGVRFNLKTVEEMIFNLPEVQQLNPEERLEYGMELLNGYMLTEESTSILHRLYVECRKINDEQFFKKQLVYRALSEELERFNTAEEIEQQLNKARYCVLGEYYLLPRRELPVNPVIFDKEGKLLKSWKIHIDPVEDDIELICDEMYGIPLCNEFSEDKVKKISEQIKERFEQYRISAEGECEDRGIAIIGNIIKLHYVDWVEETETEQIFMDFYSIDEDGNLQLIPKRSRTQNNR